MHYMFAEECVRDDEGGFWIFNKFQTFAAILIAGLFMLILRAFLPLYLQIILSVVTGGILGFLLGAKYRGIPGFMYAWSFLRFHILRLVAKNDILYASNFTSQSVIEANEETDYKLVGVKTSLPKNL